MMSIAQRAVFFISLIFFLGATSFAETNKTTQSEAITETSTVQAPATTDTPATMKPTVPAGSPDETIGVFQSPPPIETPQQEKNPKPIDKNEKSPGLWKETLGSSKESRELTRYGLLGNFSLFEMWVLTKYGFTLNYIHDSSWTYELEYMRGSLSFGFFGLNIGRMQEQRTSLLARSFGNRNSLNFLMGVFYGSFDIHLGSTLLNSVPGVPASQIDLVRTHAMGVTWGIGNRWQTKQGYVLGVDWFVINLPLTHFDQKSAFLDVSNDSNYEDQVRNALNLLNKIPSVGIIKIQAGMSF